MSEDLVQIRKAGEGTLSRRNFLKILGSASAVGAAGCADSNVEKILPHFKGEGSQIPGVAVWYASTCGECSAGCGIQVRTREGRAVKIEGNPENPINRGGLCALGQSALQSLYDPDRVRQPLARSTDANGNTVFKPISWSEAISKVSAVLKDNEGEKILISSELSGSISDLIGDFSKAHNVTTLSYDLMQPTAAAKASELTFGVYGIPTYSFDKADVVVNFGADFLETWVSPCEYARDWATARRGKKPIKVIHIEPRLSLTGANSDLWLTAKPGTETILALGLLKLVLEKGKGSNLSDSVLQGAKKLTSGLSIGKVASETGVATEKILLVAEYLSQAEAPLVIAGGTVARGDDAVMLHSAANLLNLVLGSVGTTVNLSKTRKVSTSLTKLKEAVKKLDDGKVKLLMIAGTNPVFSLPSSYGFGYGIRKAGTVVSFSSHLDETSEFADLILPSHTSLESWGDSSPTEGVFGLIQPTMTPVFDTKSLGDTLIELSAKAGKAEVAKDSKTFADYVKAKWKAFHAGLSDPEKGDFDSFWRKSLEMGGHYSASSEGRARVDVNPAVFSLPYGESSESGHDHELKLYPFFSVKSFDGRAANRPWLQELPDPISLVMWDQWAELHPDTAHAHGLAHGDLVSLTNKWGQVNLPVYITEYVQKGIVAVPIGQGHKSYGRFAKTVGGGNVLELIPAAKDGNDVSLYSAMVAPTRARGRATLVTSQITNSQEGRGLAKTRHIDSDGHAIDGDHHGHGGGSHNGQSHNGHAVKQMYEQRQHPLYEWGMTVDLASCTGCGACVVACYAENNIPVVGKKLCYEGRDMAWIQIHRYYEGPAEELTVSFLPMMCQHCQNAPCEPVCPVYATYHNEEGLNAMLYNRCVGTRYCSNNCSYKVRKFNWVDVEFPDTYQWQLNPDVTKRTMGVMEKCSFCVQRIVEAKDIAKDLGRAVLDGEVQPACVQSCPTQSLTFGNLKDPDSRVNKIRHEREGVYKVLDHHLNTQPSVAYIENVKYKV